MGPIQIFLLGSEDFQATNGIANELTALHHTGTIRIIATRFLLRTSPAEVVALRLSDLHNNKHTNLRTAANALAALDTETTPNNDNDTTTKPTLTADAALDIDELGLSAAEISALAEELEIGNALLLLVIENIWATGFANALRNAHIVFAQQDYLSPQALIALAAILELDITLDK